MKHRRDFGDLPEEFTSRQGSSIAVIPVPFERSSSWMKGSSRGPSAVIKASANMELYDIPTGTEAYKKGIYTAPDVTSDNPKDMIENLSLEVSRFIKEGKFVAVIGGEHTVSVGIARAMKEVFGSFSILHLDAHSDLREEYEGDRFSHACAVSRMREYTGDIVSAGIRSMDSSEVERLDKERVFFARDIYNSDSWMDEIVEMLGENVFLNIDLDVLDPSQMPSTGTPEPGGLTWYDITALAEKVSASRNIAAVDAVELRPDRRNPAPDFLAAKLLYRVMSLKFAEID